MRDDVSPRRNGEVTNRTSSFDLHGERLRNITREIIFARRRERDGSRH